MNLSPGHSLAQSQLSCSTSWRTTVITRRKSEDEASHRVELDRAVTAGSISCFISHDRLGYQPDKNCQYLNDDTLIFRVLVQASDDKPWLHPGLYQRLLTET